MGDTPLELTGAALALLLGWRHGADGLVTAAGLLFTFTLLALAWLDARSLWLPTLTLPLLWVGLLYTSLRAPAATLPELGRRRWAMAWLAGLNAIHLILRRRHLGGGDLGGGRLAGLGRCHRSGGAGRVIWALFTASARWRLDHGAGGSWAGGWLWPGFTLL